MKEAQNLTGQKFGRLSVLSFDHKDEKSRKRFWKCQCNCGNIVIVYQNHLKSGHTKSCGCLHSRQDINVKHGCCRRKVPKERVYKIWAGIKNRCLNDNNQAFSRYGGREISICEEWLNFETFKSWALNNGYKDDLTINRIDVNGDYEPSNCRWATPKEQANNRRNSTLLTFNGETHTLSEWENITGISQKVISSRINKLNWSIENSLTKPTKKYKKE